MIVDRFAVPGFREAVQRQTDLRDDAFLEFTAIICGIEIRQMTPHDFLILDAANSPFLSGNAIELSDIARFLWILSPEYRPRAKWAQRRFGRVCRKINTVEAALQIDKYLEVTFQDSPGSSGGNRVSFAGWCAHLINYISSEYGWTRDEIMSCPLRILYQLQRCIRKSHDPDAILFNPSDEITRKSILLKQQRLNLLNELVRRATSLGGKN